MSSPADSSSNGDGGDYEKSNDDVKTIKSIWRSRTWSRHRKEDGDSPLNIHQPNLTNVSIAGQQNSMLEDGSGVPGGGRGVLHFLVSRLWNQDQEASLFPQGSETTEGSSSAVAGTSPSRADREQTTVRSVYLTNLNPADYEQYLLLGMSLHFARSNDEEKFSEKLRGSYRYIAPMIGTFYTLCTVLLNFLVGVIVLREHSTRLLCAWIGNMIVNLILCLYLIRFGRASFQWTTRKAEVTCLICLLINPVIISVTSVIYRAKISGSSSEVFRAYSRDIDFWILEWSSICISIAFIDLWQISRTKNTIYAHLLLSAIVIFSRIFWLQTIPSEEREGRSVPFGAPKHYVEIWTTCLQCCVLISIIWQMYCSRYLEELRERLLFIANRCNLTVLSKLREAEKAERKFMEQRNEGLSLSERITQPLNRAMLEILNLAFKEEESGDLYLLELNEQLKSCVALISANAEQLFEIKTPSRDTPGGGGGGGGEKIESSAPKRVPAANVIDGSILLRGANEGNQFLGDQLGAGGPPDSASITSPSYLREVGKELDIGCIKLFQERKDFLLETAFCVMKDLEPVAKIDQQTLIRYIFLVQQRHWNNPYHNRGHVAMVVHMTKLFCDAFKLGGDDNLMGFSTILAALGHDVAHGGRNSQFIITDGIERNNNLLVDLCGTSNVVEGLHAHISFRLAQVEGCNIFKMLEEPQYRLVREYVIDLILATNMASHFEILGALRLRHQSGVADWHANVEDQLLLRKIILKAADLAHACVSWTEHLEWSTRIVNEFYQQGDLEIALKYTISPLCDRKNVNQWASSQLSYVTEVVMPLFTQLSLLPHQKVFADALLVVSINQDQWKKPQTFKQLNEQIAPYKYEDALLYASVLAPSTLLDKQPQNAPAFIASQGNTRRSALPVAKRIESNVSSSASESDAGEDHASSPDDEDNDSQSDNDGGAVSGSASDSDHEESPESSSEPNNSSSASL